MLRFLILIIYYGIPNQCVSSQKYSLNAARFSHAWMSTTHLLYGKAENAIDGKKDNTHISFCVHTADNSYDSYLYRWWRTDLLHYYDIYFVSITNRGDCCGSRLKNFKVLIAAELDSMHQSSSEGEKLCFDYKGSVGQGATVDMECLNKPIFGRYATVFLPSQTDEYSSSTYGAPLHFCEFEVYALRVLRVGETIDWDYRFISDRRMLQVGAHCTQSTARTFCPLRSFCEIHPIPERNKCVILFSKSCVGHERFCEKTTICDEGICRIQAGESCELHPAMCRSKTVCSDGKCLHRLGEVCHLAVSNVCQQGICEMSRCRIPIGSTCYSSTSPCVSGSTCQNSACRCQEGISRPNGSLCEPIEGIVGGACIAKGACSQSKAFCNSTAGKNICECPAGHTPYHVDFSCRKEAGQPCTYNNDCASGTKCGADKKCRLNLDENCIGPSSKFCEEGTECDRENLCRYKVKSECTSNPSMCRAGTVCENYNGRKFCKLDVGEVNCTWTSDDPCRASAKCDIKGNVCKLRAGQNCSGLDIHNCHSDGICNDGNTCRNKVGKPCDAVTPCRLGLTCENNTCKLHLGADCTGNENQCRKGLVCDRLQRCKREKGGSCAGNPDICLAGAVCIDSVCRCNDEDVSKADTILCDANAGRSGGFCSKPPGCVDPHSFCQQSKCVCNNGYVINPRDYSCKLKPGADCSSNPKDCVAGTFCDFEHKCTLKLQENCAGESGGHCQLGTVCGINGVCLLTVNANCSGFAKDSCDIGKICDAMRICKNPIQGYCDEDDSIAQCMAGSICTANTCQCDVQISELSNDMQTCIPNPSKAEGSCNPADNQACEDLNAICDSATHTCQCTYPYAVTNDLTCKLLPGQTCDENIDSCVSYSVCEGSICKLVGGSHCSQSESLCQAGGVCDIDSICRLDYNGDCLYRENSCKVGLVCDNLYKCRIAVDNNCNDSTDFCMSGGYCLENKCVCESIDIAIKSGSLCKPAANRVGGECSVESSCLDPNAFCNDTSQSCTCTEGYYTDNRTYSCVSQLGKSISGEGSQTWLILFCSLMAAVAVIAAVAVSFRRKVQKRESAINEEKQRSKAISQLGEEVKEDIAAESETSVASEMESSTVSDMSETKNTETSITQNTETSITQIAEKSEVRLKTI